MAGISDLSVLLSTMEPILWPAPYGIVVVAEGTAIPGAFAEIAEAEGRTVIAEAQALARHHLAVEPEWARISLSVHSDLAAVGLTAAISAALAARRISANIVAGFYHDHVFVQWSRRHDAMAALKEVSHA